MEILRYAAFTDRPEGGNPAGIVLAADGLDDSDMQRIAADVGFSETAFLTPTGAETANVRYFAPIAEVAFCGHATIASAVARAERIGTGRLTLHSVAGPIEVTTEQTANGILATLVSVPPVVSELSDEVTAELLAALRLTPADLDPALPVRVSYSGNHHPIVGVPLPVLDRLDHDQPRLAAVMAANGWGATVAVVSRAVVSRAVVSRTSGTEFEARNPFPPGDGLGRRSARRVPPRTRPGRPTNDGDGAAGQSHRQAGGVDRPHPRGGRRHRGVRWCGTAAVKRASADLRQLR